MTKGNGRPCKKCGASEWYKSGQCKQCQINSALRWQAGNLEKKRESDRRWKRNNPEKRNEQKRRQYHANPDRTHKRLWSWRQNNPEKRAAADHRHRTRKTRAGGSYTAVEFKALCEQYDGRCACCGKKKKLTFDHVIPVAKGGTSDISNGQPLCRSCNASKGDKSTDYRTKPGVMRWIQKKLFKDSKE